MKILAIFTLSSLLFSYSAMGLERKSYIVKNLKQLQDLKGKAFKKNLKPDEKAWINWQLALNAPLFDKGDIALEAINRIQGTKTNLISQDQLDLTKGRILFQLGKFDQALSSYQSVPKSSEYWFEALEEEAWSYVRLNQFNKATSKVTTLLSPLFSTWVGPESYFLANYNALKICDYTTILKNGVQFKERHLARIQQLEALSKTKANSKSVAAIEKLTGLELNFMNYADEATALPRFFWRDEFIVKQVEKLKAASAANKAKAIALAKKEISARLSTLAKSELSEYQTVINKLQIIEAEVIQRLYLDESLKGVRPNSTELSKSSDDLVFPYSDEVWLDEIDKYQAKIKVCPQLKEAQL